MLPEYRTIYRGGEDEIIEKKSRFIATVVPVNTEEEALEFVEKTRKKYWDARHNCFAYIIGERGQLQRCSDDGEPNGTAGKPMQLIRFIVCVLTCFSTLITIIISVHRCTMQG